MQKPSLEIAIGKLAIAGEHAGFTVEQMIQLLDDGLTVETLLDLISAILTSHQRRVARRCGFIEDR